MKLNKVFKWSHVSDIKRLTSWNNIFIYYTLSEVVCVTSSLAMRCINKIVYSCYKHFQVTSFTFVVVLMFWSYCQTRRPGWRLLCNTSMVPLLHYCSPYLAGYTGRVSDARGVKAGSPLKITGIAYTGHDCGLFRHISD